MKDSIIAIADDHAIVRSGIRTLLSSHGFKVEKECENGAELVAYCMHHPVDIVLMDINMKVMDGFEATRLLRDSRPEVKVIALSMLNSELALIRMLRAGARSFVPKDANPDELIKAITTVLGKGYYYSEFVSDRLLPSFANNGEHGVDGADKFNQKELDFLRLACSELTYREIADRMCVSHRSVDGYRDALFQKLQVKSRVGLAIYAIREGLVEL